MVVAVRAALAATLFASTPLVQLVTGSLFVENVWAALILGAALALWSGGAVAAGMLLGCGAGDQGRDHSVSGAGGVVGALAMRKMTIARDRRDGLRLHWWSSRRRRIVYA